MSWFFIEPEDVWTFRGARAALGGGSVSKSDFPPAPLTVQGALRSLILCSSGVDWAAFREQSTPEAREIANEIGHPAREGAAPSLGTFLMAGPFLAREEGDVIVRYMPLPADVRRTKGRNARYFSLRPSSSVEFASNWPAADLHPLWTDVQEESEEPELPEWLSERALAGYLRGRGFSGLGAGALFESESRLGIALDYARRRPLESLLYQSEFVRPKPGVGLLVWLGDAVSLPDQEGTLRLGGEGRSAYYRKVDDEIVFGEGETQPGTERFKIIFRTPAYFDGGWQPSAQSGGWPALLGVDARLVAVAVDHPQHISGWDVASRGGRGFARPLYAYVPAGSVYFFESDQPVALPQDPISQTPAGGSLSLTRIGFGQIAVGTWDWLN